MAWKFVVRQHLPNTLPQCSKGNALVEFALGVPLLVMLALGTLQYGFLFLGGISVANAARVGAMDASLTSEAALDQAHVCAAVQHELRTLLTLSGDANTNCDGNPLKVESASCKGTDPCGNAGVSPDGEPAVAVTVRLKMPTWLPLGNATPIQRTAKMRIRAAE
jgi:Flp pilus assembly protein TadG